MRGKKLSIGLRVTLAIVALPLLAASAYAATENVLYSFQNNGQDGEVPVGSLIFDKAGNLYGTTYQGGAYNFGTVFELTPASGGGWTETVLHTFGSGTDGGAPYGGLIFDASGNLYGTTQVGGADGYGTVFELTPKTKGVWKEKVLHSFDAANGKDASGPLAGVIFDASGNLYGTSELGGVYDYGTVFELTAQSGRRLEGEGAA